jgi:4-hydroxybenzoate polyprenyltransferase
VTALAAESALPLLRRLWIYQAERIPLGRTALLVAVFASSSVNVSAHLGHRPLPSWPSYAVAFIAVLIFFFQLRACDEIKDAEDDARYRPERPIPRGLVALRTIVALAVAALPLSALAAALLDLRLLWLLCAVWAWMGLMAAEFFVPDWLRARPLAYLVSHMLIMPLIDLFVTACEWLPAGASPPGALVLFLVLSFLNGTVLEIGRKIYAPANERTGVETYSALLGLRAATATWLAVVAAAFGFLLAVGAVAHALVPVAILGLIGLAACAGCALMLARRADGAWQKRIDAVSGLWVLLCYGAAGFAPLVQRVWS